MVSKQRHFEPGSIYHVFNRGALRQQLFQCDQDYAGFESLIKDTFSEIPIPIFTYELMPNHWHFVVQPTDRYQLSSFFQQLAGTHGKRFRAASQTIGDGHVYQDRFKSFPVESDGHFLAVCRYTERNAKRAKLVERAEDWRWGALWRRQHGSDDWLTSTWPVPRPDDWIDRVNEPLTASEMAAIRRCIVRGTPFGSPDWVQNTAERLQLNHTLRSVGRPRRIAQ
jgi:putative transposase